MFRVTFNGKSSYVTFSKLSHMKQYMTLNELSEEDIGAMAYLSNETTITNLWTPPKVKREKKSKLEKLQDLIEKLAMYEEKIEQIKEKINKMKD